MVCDDSFWYNFKVYDISFFPFEKKAKFPWDAMLHNIRSCRFIELHSFRIRKNRFQIVHIINW